MNIVKKLMLKHAIAYLHQFRVIFMIAFKVLIRTHFPVVVIKSMEHLGWFNKIGIQDRYISDKIVTTKKY